MDSERVAGGSNEGGTLPSNKFISSRLTLLKITGKTSEPCDPLRTRESGRVAVNKQAHPASHLSLALKLQVPALESTAESL